MKKLTAIIILLALAFASCTKSTDDDIAAGLETYRDIYVGTPAPVQTESVSEETELAVPEEMLPANYGTSVEGIVSPDFVINDGKMYFELKGNEASGTTIMHAYVDLKTGNFSYVCNDPLCGHDNTEECRYLNLQTLTFTDKPGICYGVRCSDQPFTIYRVDLNRDTLTAIGEFDGLSTELIGCSRGKLYYADWENVTDDRQTKRITRLYSADDSTGKSTEIRVIPEEWEMAPLLKLLWHDGNIYFTNSDTLCVTDLSFKNVREIFRYTEVPGTMFLDNNTGELFFSQYDKDRRSGSVYVYRDGDVTELTLPHSEIYYFTMDNEKFYYSTYDPIYYGISNAAYYQKKDPNKCMVYDYSGGKIYAVDRDNPSQNAELIYDNNGETILCNGNHHYTVIDGYLYYDEVAVKREVLGGMEFTTIASAEQQEKIRVNLADGTSFKIALE